MSSWHDRRVTELFGIELPVIQAPMAGAVTPEMVVAVSEAGGLGSMPTALVSLEQLRGALGQIRAETRKPFNLNFFTHAEPTPDPTREAAWQTRLEAYYLELGLDPAAPVGAPGIPPFREVHCGIVEEYRPAVVSFHFGLPKPELVARVRRTGAKVIASATTVAEARWLGQRQVDAVIAMGLEAGGHRGSFLTEDMATQVGTMALVPQIVDAVDVPVIAAGGIADRRGVRAAFALGASAVQVGTAYLFTPEARIPPGYREALRTARDDGTALTNVFTGRPVRALVNRLMREIGPMSDLAPAFPMAAGAVLPLRAASEKAGRVDFTGMAAGQAAALAREMSAAALTRYLGEDD